MAVVAVGLIKMYGKSKDTLHGFGIKKPNNYWRQ